MADPQTSPEVGVETLARLFNLTTRRVQQLARDGVIPRAKRGRYPLIEAVQGYVSYLQARVTGEDVSDVKRNLRAEQLRKARLENDATEGKSLPTDEVVEMLLEVGLLFASSLDAAPSRLAPLVAHKDQQDCLAVLQTEHRRIRDETATKIQSLVPVADAGADSEGAALAVAASVGS